jgi:mono/diheme cytochrome c family protein
MAPVADNLANVSDEDVTAIAVYVASVMGEPSQERREQGENLIRAVKSFGTGSKPQSGGSQAVPAAAIGDPGAIIYAGACASCHESGRSVPYGGIHLSLSTLLSTSSPRNFLNLVLAGLPAADGQRGPIMPGFAAMLTDQQVVALAGYMRSQFSNKPAWSDIAEQLREARSSQTTPSLDARPMPIATGN